MKRNYIKEIGCYIKAIPFWIRSHIWCPHIYGETEYTPAIIIASKNSFRISKDYKHNENEKVYPKATLITSKCICCGKKEISWYDSEPIIINGY